MAPIATGQTIVPEDGNWDIDLPFLKSLKYFELPNDGSDVGGVVAVGTIIAVETSEGNFAKLQVIQLRQDAGEIGFEWALFDQ